MSDYEEPGPSNQLQFDGIFKGKENEIRITPDKMISVFDFIRVVGGQSQPDKTWKNVIKNHNEEVRIFYTNFKFQGQGQKLTPVINVKGMVKLLFWLPGEMAKQFRSKSAETMIRYLGGDLTLVEEIKKIDNHHETNPDNVAQIFREEVQKNQILFSQDEVNNSKRLMEHFGPKGDIFYMLVLKYLEEYYAKIGIVRDSKQLHQRYKNHQDEFGEVCLHLAIQCSDINSVENEFKQSSFFRTNKANNIPNKNGGFHAEILKLSELVTTETIKEKMKLVAGDRIVDPPPEYTEETPLYSLEIEKEKTRQMEIQKTEETKQLEIQENTKLQEIQANKELELKKLELAHQLELKKLEMSSSQLTPQVQQSNPEPTVDNRMAFVTGDQDYVINLVKKFMESQSVFSTKRADYIFIEDLFNRFEMWFHSLNTKTATPVSQAGFSKCIARIPEYTVMRIAIGPRVGNVTPRKSGVIHRKFNF